ncbi:MAG: hypothetical protein GW809_04725 [Bacteroidetes bacterium]|nr:hypothetical protein [Bacteroidota bacterium]
MKSVLLPRGLAHAIEAKLEADLSAERLEFFSKEQELDARRQLIEATGITDAQRIISAGLKPLILQFRQIEALQQVSTFPNEKVVISDGKTFFSIGYNLFNVEINKSV